MGHLFKDNEKSNHIPIGFLSRFSRFQVKRKRSEYFIIQTRGYFYCIEIDISHDLWKCHKFVFWSEIKCHGSVGRASVPKVHWFETRLTLDSLSLRSHSVSKSVPQAYQGTH